VQSWQTFGYNQLTGIYVPLEHNIHAVTPVVEENVPGGQDLYLEEPETFTYDPA
jgi:hypothetical protein